MRATKSVARRVAARLSERSRRLVRRRSARRTALDQEVVRELIRLIDNLLRQYGRDVKADDSVIRCFATHEFLVATYAVEPGLAIYQVSQHADGESISQVFVATWHGASGTPDLRLYRDGPWRRRFQSFADDALNPPPRLLH